MANLASGTEHFAQEKTTSDLEIFRFLGYFMTGSLEINILNFYFFTKGVQ